MGSSGSGEGSRGGQIIGHTRGGKPIYASHLNSTGKMAHAATVAGVAPGAARPAVFQVTHGSDGAVVHRDPTTRGARAEAASALAAKAPTAANHAAAMRAHQQAAELSGKNEGAYDYHREKAQTHDEQRRAALASVSAGGGGHPHAVGTRARGSDADRPAVLNKPGYRGR